MSSCSNAHPTVAGRQPPAAPAAAPGTSTQEGASGTPQAVLTVIISTQMLFPLESVQGPV